MPRCRIAALLVILAGCGSGGGLTQTDGSPYAPSTVDRDAEAVDGLVVGHRLMEAGEYELALKAFLRAAAEHGLDADVLSGLGSANLRLGRLGQAEALLRRAVEADPDFATAWNNLGVVLMERGEAPEASRVFGRAVALDGGRDEDMRANLTGALAKMENSSYSDAQKPNFALVRRGPGEFRIRKAP